LLARPAETFPDYFAKTHFLNNILIFCLALFQLFFLLSPGLSLSFTLKKHSLHLSPYDNYLILQRKSPTFKNGIESTDTSVARQNESLEEVPEAERALPLRSLLIPRVLIPAAILPLYRSWTWRCEPFSHFLLHSHSPWRSWCTLPLIGTLLSGQAVLGGLFQVYFLLGSTSVSVRKKHLWRDHLCNPYICYVSCCQRHCALSRTWL